MTKVAIVGLSGGGIARVIIDALKKEPVVINADNGVVDFFGTQPQDYPTSMPERKHSRNTGAARIKRNAKQRRRRKG